MNFFNIGPLELMLIMLVVLIVFGPGKLPEIGKALGQAMREFREMSRDITTQFSEGMEMLELETKEKEQEDAETTQSLAEASNNSKA